MTINPRVHASTTACLAALVGVGLVLLVAAYFPFQWDPPRVVDNDVTRSADGSLRFDEMNRARTSGTPDWLAAARTSGHVEIHLEMAPQTSQENSPASIMMLSPDFSHTDFTLGQKHSELLLWLRRPGSDANGGPPFTVGALLPGRWNSVHVRLRDDVLRIDVNGARRLTEPLPADSLRLWGAGQVALGGEVDGGVPWQGEIRRAEVRTASDVIDYARPGALSIPAHFLYLPDHVAPFSPLGTREWIVLLLHLLSFIPVGLLIVWGRSPHVRPVPATLLAAGFAVALAAGKFLFHGRHAEVADLVAQTTGALLGALLARRWADHQEQAPPRDGRDLEPGPATMVRLHPGEQGPTSSVGA